MNKNSPEYKLAIRRTKDYINRLNIKNLLGDENIDVTPQQAMDIQGIAMLSILADMKNTSEANGDS